MIIWFGIVEKGHCRCRVETDRGPDDARSSYRNGYHNRPFIGIADAVDLGETTSRQPRMSHVGSGNTYVGYIRDGTFCFRYNVALARGCKIATSGRCDLFVAVSNMAGSRYYVTLLALET